MTVRAALAFMNAAALLVAACGGGPGPARIGRRAPVVTSYTDSSSVTALAVAGSWLIVGPTDGIDRYDLRGGDPVAAPSPAIAALAVAPVSAALGGPRVLVAAADGIGTYDPSTGTLGPRVPL